MLKNSQMKMLVFMIKAAVRNTQQILNDVQTFK